MNGYKFNWHLLESAIPRMLQGFIMSIEIAIVVIILSMILAVPLAVARMSKIEIVRWLAQGYIEIFRCTPMLVQLFWIYYALPMLTGIVLPGFASAVLALSANLTAFMAEAYRSGFQAVPIEQIEAGKMLRLTRFQQMRYIIFRRQFASKPQLFCLLNNSDFQRHCTRFDDFGRPT